MCLKQQAFHLAGETTLTGRAVPLSFSSASAEDPGATQARRLAAVLEKRNTEPLANERPFLEGGGCAGAGRGVPRGRKRKWLGHRQVQVSCSQRTRERGVRGWAGQGGVVREMGTAVIEQ